jgi:hypothetical protein
MELIGEWNIWKIDLFILFPISWWCEILQIIYSLSILYDVDMEVIGRKILLKGLVDKGVLY